MKELALTLKIRRESVRDYARSTRCRMIVVDEEGFSTLSVSRHIFGNGAFIETAGGGVEVGETI